MKYYVVRVPAKDGDQPLETLQSEPNELMIGSLAVKYGPIEVIPEMLAIQQATSAYEQGKEYLSKILPQGIKLDWKEKR